MTTYYLKFDARKGETVIRTGGEIVAVFLDSFTAPLAMFMAGAARVKGVSVFDEDAGHFLIGTIDQMEIGKNAIAA